MSAVKSMLCAALIALVLSTLTQAAEPIRIGLTASLTGDYSELSQLQLQGLRQFVADLTQRGALLGRQIELVVYDDESDEDRTLALYRRLIEQEGLQILISPYSSSQTIAIRDYINGRNVAMLAVASAPEIWNRPDPRIFGLFTPADENMHPLLELATSKGLMRLALTYQQSEFPEAVARGVRQWSKANGLTIVFDEAYSETTVDYQALALKMVKSQPEVVVIGSYLEDGIAFAAAAKAARLAPALFAFSGGAALREFGDSLGIERANGMISTVQWMRDVRFPGSFDFGFRYRQLHGFYPNYEPASGYAALQVLEAAIRLAGSIEPELVRDKLLTMKFRSILGHYRVNDHGRQTAKTTYLVQWQDEHISLVYPPDVARFGLRYPYQP